MISRVMKRVFVLLMVALMSAVVVNAKTVRGYVSDNDGNPVVGMKWLSSMWTALPEKVWL